MRTETSFGLPGNQKYNQEWASDISYFYLGLWIPHVVLGGLEKCLIIHSINLSHLANDRRHCYLATNGSFCTHNMTHIQPFIEQQRTLFQVPIPLLGKKQPFVTRYGFIHTSNISWLATHCIECGFRFIHKAKTYIYATNLNP